MTSGIAPWKTIVIVSLLGLNVSLVAVAGLAVLSDNTPLPAHLDRSVPISPPGKTLSEAKPIANYSQVLAHPVFFKSRAPFVPPPPPPPPAPAAQMRPPPPVVVDPGLVLGGIMMIQGARKAYLFKRADPAGVWVGAGDDVFGWKIEHIDAIGIALRNGDRVLDLQLYTER